MKIFTILLAAALPLIFGCSKVETEKAGIDALFPQKIGNAEFSAKIALTNQEKAKGLMGIKQMGENEGMIFVSDFPHMASFWMKNTPIALDIAFLDAHGKVLEVKQMFPHDETAVRSTSSDVCYCIEMNRGWFLKNSVKSGDFLDMKKFYEAVKRRRGVN